MGAVATWRTRISGAQGRRFQIFRPLPAQADRSQGPAIAFSCHRGVATEAKRPGHPLSGPKKSFPPGLYRPQDFSAGLRPGVFRPGRHRRHAPTVSTESSSPPRWVVIFFPGHHRRTRAHSISNSIFAANRRGSFPRAVFPAAHFRQPRAELILHHSKKRLPSRPAPGPRMEPADEPPHTTAPGWAKFHTAMPPYPPIRRRPHPRAADGAGGQTTAHHCPGPGKIPHAMPPHPPIRRRPHPRAADGAGGRTTAHHCPGPGKIPHSHPPSPADPARAPPPGRG